MKIFLNILSVVVLICSVAGLAYHTWRSIFIAYPKVYYASYLVAWWLIINGALAVSNWILYNFRKDYMEKHK